MIGADVAAALPEMRAAAESLMLDQGRALRLGEPVYDPDEQTSTPAVEELFESRCKVKSGAIQAAVIQLGERTAAVVKVELHLPISTPPLRAGDEWEVTEPHALSAVPVGRRYRVISPFEKSLATARRYDVEEVVS